VLLALPCAVALLVFPKPMVAVLYHYGAFSPRDVQQTVLALMGYGVGLMGLVGVKVLAPGFYARQDMRTPVRIAIGMLVLTQLMNLVFVPRLGHAGLALSIGLAALLNALLLSDLATHRVSERVGTTAHCWCIGLVTRLSASILFYRLAHTGLWRGRSFLPIGFGRLRTQHAIPIHTDDIAERVVTTTWLHRECL